MKKDNIKFLETLLNAATPSGSEEVGVRIFENHMSKFSKHLFTDNMNNSVFSKGKEGSKKVLISGHIDSISMMVTNITEFGLLNVMSGGGMDKKVLPGSKVSVISSTGIIYSGVIGKKPIHIEYENPDEYNKVTKFEDLTVDLGYSEKEDVEKLGIGVGSKVIYKRNETDLYFGKGGDYICSPDLDDKIGVYITSEVLRRVEENSLNIHLIGAAMTQEEVGLRGSYVAASRINPDISIDIDVTFDTRDHGISQAIYGDVQVGRGPVIEFGADKNNKLANRLIEIAKNKNIPYQTYATMPGGTNTDAIQMRSFDCITMHVAIPLRNMHTPVEIVSWDDVENCINLLVEYILSV